MNEWTEPSCINNVMNVDRYWVGNDTQAVFDSHVVLKDTALAEKERHKTTTPESTSVVTEDTEALLVAPKNNSSELYRTKLNCHNLMYFDLKTKDVMDFLWNEVSGGLEASVFTSIHVDYIRTHLEENQHKASNSLE